MMQTQEGGSNSSSSLLLSRSIENLRAGFMRLRERQEPIVHVLVQSRCPKRAQVLLARAEQEVTPTKRKFHIARQPVHLYENAYSLDEDLSDFVRLTKMGSQILASIEPVTIATQYRPEVFPPCGWDRIWTRFVHVLGWFGVPKSTHAVTRYTCLSDQTSFPVDEALEMQQAPRGFWNRLIDLSAVPSPPDWYSVVQDMVLASISALDIVDDCLSTGLQILRNIPAADATNPQAQTLRNKLSRSGVISDTCLADLFEIKLSTLNGYLSQAGLNTRTAGQRHAIVLDRESLMKLYRFYQREHSKALACQILHAALFSSARRP